MKADGKEERMKVLISADMDGTCGVVSWVQVMPPEYVGAGQMSSTVEYERARMRMTREVNAAVEGALAAGADEVIVNESHDGMRNLIPEELHPDIHFINGSDKQFSMMQGIDEDDVGAVFFTGYHARAGTPAAPLAHSFTGWVQDIRVDGTAMGEYGINALVAGHYGVPVALVTGDDKAVSQTRELLGNEVVGVEVKKGYSTTSGIHLHPTRAQEMIRDGAEQAIKNLASMTPYVLPSGATVEVELDHQSKADAAERIPTVERSGWRTCSFQPADAAELMVVFRAILTAAGTQR
ncbi:MAG TPA: M55 family metallopeptidase [Mycobacterium sp.]|nr:M55 family metallopeptidase [Mycobacterium sp.]